MLAGPVQELINLALACDMAVCSLVSASLHTQGKTEQILRTVSLQGLFAIFVSHSGKGALVGSLQLVRPNASPTAFASCNSLLNCQDLSLKAVFSIRECLGVLHSQTSYHHRLLLGYHHRGPEYPKNGTSGTRPHWCTRDCKKYLKRGPCYPKAFIPATGKQRRRGIWGTSIWKIKEILAGSGIFQMGKVYNSKSLYSGIAWGTGLGTKTATVILDGQLLCVKKDTAVWIWCYRRRILNQ